ncbi:MAG TPA: AMP-binding protein [Gammaproteobacteria bacterium]|nr:AMP-binding protein [Gammaproteobacteria bacterium]
MIRLAKFLLRRILKLLYGVEVSGLENYHKAGDRVLIVANHTSLLDGILLYAWLPETPTFAINTTIADKKSFRPFLKFVDLFIMDPTSPLSVKSMIKFLKQDRKAVIFPEGRITITGSLMKIYEGPGLVADKAGAAILPIAIDGPQFSPMSYMKGRGRIVRFPKITLTILPPTRISVAPEIQGHERRKAISLQLQDLMFRLIYSTFDYRTTLFDALLTASERYGKNTPIIEDITREPNTYKQLIQRSLILGRAIRDDTEPNEHVGIMMPNVIGTVITFMALQYIGRIPAMLNFSVGQKIILKACETGRIKTVYTSRKFIESANLHEIAETLERELNVIYLEDIRQRVSLIDKLTGLVRAGFVRRHYRRMARDRHPDDPALILFTSGSEGIPKGVVLSHSNLLSNYAQVSCHIDFQPTDILFSCLPLFHSFGLNAGCLMPLLGGSRIFLYPTPLHYRIIPELVYEIGATILFGTNTFFKGYARHAHPFDFHSCRYVVAGAEKLRDNTQQRWMEKFGIRILQGYGVTEASPVISVNTPMLNKMGTTGRCMPDMESYLEPVPGIEHGGRLIVRGPNVMLGYLLHDKPGKLQPPSTDRGHGWYDTGDIAEIDEEGFITILGRAKRFAKIGGEMISLTAVEELALQIWPDFNHAAVNLPDEKKGEKIVLVTDNKEAMRKQLQDYARKHKYGELYVPKKVVLAEELPVLGTGKTDYTTLTDMALVEDKTGSGWLGKLTGLVKKQEQNAESTSDQTGNSVIDKTHDKLDNS